MRRLTSPTATIDRRRNGTEKTFVSPSTAIAASIMANIEAARLYRFGQGRARLLVDVRAQFAFHHRIEERENFTLYPANLKLDATVRQISHPTNDIETLGDLTN